MEQYRLGVRPRPRLYVHSHRKADPYPDVGTHHVTDFCRPYHPEPDVARAHDYCSDNCDSDYQAPDWRTHPVPDYCWPFFARAHDYGPDDRWPDDTGELDHR